MIEPRPQLMIALLAVFLATGIATFFWAGDFLMAPLWARLTIAGGVFSVIVGLMIAIWVTRLNK